MAATDSSQHSLRVVDMLLCKHIVIIVRWPHHASLGMDGSFFSHGCSLRPGLAYGSLPRSVAGDLTVMAPNGRESLCPIALANQGLVGLVG